MFERFSDAARQVVVFAQNEARALKHDFIGTEHLLLGLLSDEDDEAARVLAGLGVRPEDVRAHVTRTVGVGEEASPGQIPFAAGAKKTLELALREALSLGQADIGTVHILLGLVRVDDGLAATILRDDYGLDAGAVRAAVVSAVGEPVPEPRRRRGRRRVSWSYRVEPLGALETADDLAPLGAEGWELVAVLGDPGAYRGVFRRPA